MVYGDPEIDEMLVKLTDEVMKLEDKEDFSNAILKLDELTARLEAFSVATDDGVLKRVYNSTLRDRRLLKRILQMKEKYVDLELLVVELEERLEKVEYFKKEIESQK